MADPIGRACEIPSFIGDAITSVDCTIYRADHRFVEKRFVLHWLNSEKGLKASDDMAAGSTRSRISRSNLGNLSIPCPTLEEQKSIAIIIDTLDTAIQRTEAIIEKLKQVKQGLLHDLLTRGIDANGELRPTPTEAPDRYKDSPLGSIPNEWTTDILENLSGLVTSGSRGWSVYYSDSGALFVRSQNIRMGSLDFSDRQHVRPPLGGEGPRTRLESLDLLITITGNGVGNVAYVPIDWPETAYVSQHVGLVRMANTLNADLAMNYLIEGSPGSRQILDAQYGQSKPGLNLNNVKLFRIPLPPEDEKTEIIKRLLIFHI